MQICKSSDCSGCFACVNKCPKECISMREDEIGHIYPDINEDICINCGACIQVCPVNSPVSFETPLNTYAAYALDEEEHRTSSSGGVAAEFSKAVIRDGGVVYGCSSVFDNDIHHIRIETLEELVLLKGSKYVQSHIKDIHKKVKQDLLDGRKVLFIGMPCQVAGLKSFLGKEYSKLITVDLICHGVPSQRILKEHLKTYAEPPFMVTFRDEKGFTLNVLDASGAEKLYSMPHTRDLYFTGFSKCLFYRDSCYSCRYAKGERCSDVTIGDFWGLGKDIPFKGETKNGVSVILVNTEKGRTFFDTMSERMYFEERSLIEAVAGNPQLVAPSVAHRKRDKFIRLYKSFGVDIAIKKALKKEIFKYRLLYYINNSKFLTKLASILRG